MLRSKRCIVKYLSSLMVSLLCSEQYIGSLFHYRSINKPNCGLFVGFIFKAAIHRQAGVMKTIRSLYHFDRGFCIVFT